MIVKQIILANPTHKRGFREDIKDFLKVAEFFYDTIQGEGINIGHPAIFLRLQGCTQNCIWCDTKEVWRFGNPYTYREIIDLLIGSGAVSRLKDGHHFVITGGSPLLQQDRLISFLTEFIIQFGFIPYIEIENECTIMPNQRLIDLVSCWNNSPKLSSSQNPFELRYRPQILRTLSSLQNSWFKFVVSSEADWEEIENGFISPGLIKKNQIILMPLGATKKELEMNRTIVVDIAIENGVRYASREHIILWDKKTGI